MKKLKILFNLLLILFLSFGNVRFVHAGFISGGGFPKINPVDMVNQVIGDFGVDKGSLKTMTQAASTAFTKMNPTEVSLTFFPTNPITGDKVTVSATPLYFLNQPTDLYYTWFLKTANCFDAELDGPDYKSKLPAGEYFTTDSNPNYELYKNNKCNLDGDNDVDIEDYKIKAMRIIANDEFNYSQADYSTDNDNDNDGYKAYWGGDDQSGKPSKCFIHDIESGYDHEIICDTHLFPKAPNHETGNDVFGTKEEEFWHTNPLSQDTGHTGNTDEANVCGLGINNFTWAFQEGDQVGVVVEGVAVLGTSENDSSQKTVWAMSRKNYTIKRDFEIDTSKGNSKGKEVIIDPYGTDNALTTTTKTISTKNTSEVSGETSGSYASTNDATTKRVDVVTVNDTGFVNVSEKKDILTDDDYCDANGTYVNTDITTDPQDITETDPQYSTEIITLTEEEYEAFYANTLSSNSPHDITVETTSSKTVRTINQDVITCELDQDEWLYYRITTNQKRIITTINETSGDMNLFSGSSELEVKTTRINGIENFAVSNLNDFLYDALISPSLNEASSQKLDVELSYFPKPVMNDPTGEHGDTLSLISSVTNAQDDSVINYDWKVYSIEEISNEIEDWDIVLKEDLESLNASQMNGLGIDKFSFKLGFPDININYLKIILTVTENINGINREGVASVIVPIKSASGKINVHRVSVDENNGNLSLGEIICSDNSTCEVTKDSIIGLSLTNASGNTFNNFLWKLDEETITYENECPFGDNNCNKSQPIAYFPVSKEVGEEHFVTLVATNDSGDKISLSKKFKIINPSIEIVPASNDNSDNCSNIILGRYTGIGQANTNDYSDESLMSIIGRPIIISAATSGFSPNVNNYYWSVNGESFSYENASIFGYTTSGNTLTLPAREEVGDNYSVSVSTTYTKNNAIKEALYKYWGMTSENFYEKTISDHVEILIQSADAVASNDSSEKIFASLISSAPEYILFLLKLLLTGFLIIFVSKLVFIFSLKNED